MQNFCEILNDISKVDLRKCSSISSLVDPVARSQDFSIECFYCGNQVIGPEYRADIRQVHKIISEFQNTGKFKGQGLHLKNHGTIKCHRTSKYRLQWRWFFRLLWFILYYFFNFNVHFTTSWIPLSSNTKVLIFIRLRRKFEALHEMPFTLHLILCSWHWFKIPWNCLSSRATINMSRDQSSAQCFKTLRCSSRTNNCKGKKLFSSPKSFFSLDIKKPLKQRKFLSDKKWKIMVSMVFWVWE